MSSVRGDVSATSPPCGPLLILERRSCRVLCAACCSAVCFFAARGVGHSANSCGTLIVKSRLEPQLLLFQTKKYKAYNIHNIYIQMLYICVVDTISVFCFVCLFVCRNAPGYCVIPCLLSKRFSSKKHHTPSIFQMALILTNSVDGSWQRSVTHRSFHSDCQSRSITLFARRGETV